MKLPLSRTLWVSIAATLLVAAAAQAQFTITSIADTTSPTFSFFSAPAINASGQVAFSANLDAGGNGIFTGTTGGTLTIALTTGPTFNSLGSGLSINNFGVVSFQGGLVAGGTGIFTSSGGAATTIADTTGGVFSSFDNTPLLNDAGQVAFKANLVAGGSGLYRKADGGSLATIGETSGPIFSLFGGYDINQSGQVGFFAALDPSGIGIFRSDGTTLTTIATGGGFPNFTGFNQGAGINDSGTVAFTAVVDFSDEGIFTGTGGLPTTLVLRNTSGYADFLSVPALNAAGGVAFVGDPDTSPIFGLYAGADPVADKVLEQGDALFGSTLVGMGFSTQGLNDAGQIAFFYQLADGRSGIAVASPAPEPGTATLLACGALGLLARRRRR